MLNHHTCGTRIGVAAALRLALATVAVVADRTLAALGALDGVVALHVSVNMNKRNHK